MTTPPSHALLGRVLDQKKPVALTASLERNLVGYALAGAAGLGLACASPAHAAIDYTRVQIQGGANSDTGIDLNHDGIVDFSVRDIFSSRTLSGAQNGGLYAYASNHNGVAVDQSYIAHAFNAGSRIGPKQNFSNQQFGMGMAASGRTSSGDKISGGEFLNKDSKFLGLKFELDGQTYYGWARFTVKSHDFRIGYELIDFAYQTIPGVPIYSGEGIGANKGLEAAVRTKPAGSLGALAFGDAAIELWRGTSDHAALEPKQ